ncbi:MAG: hypothetical protein F4Y80_11280 [Caldilineaceae bacterium SB0665_bin_21]|nr:hypothetical protein [Caldilineaceae bacterium SB0665_bin_21]
MAELTPAELNRRTPNHDGFRQVRGWTATISELPHLRRYRIEGHGGHLATMYGITSAVLPCL